MVSLLNHIVKNLYRPLTSKLYGDHNVWLDFSDIIQWKTLTSSTLISKNINFLLNFESQSYDRYEDYNLKKHITPCDTTFTSTWITRDRRAKLMEILAPRKKLLKDMRPSRLKKYWQIENKPNRLLKFSRKWNHIRNKQKILNHKIEMIRYQH